MAYSNNDILDFFDLFSGNNRAYGVTVTKEFKDDKLESSSKLIYDSVTPAIIQKHLQGQLSIGIAPIKEDSTVNFCAIDIDNYDYDLQDIINAIYDFSLPICPCFSKSKKLHLYIFFSHSIQASDAIDICIFYKNLFACAPKTEIFPKQSSTKSANKFYSWINLPYFEADNKDNWRKLVTKEGTVDLPSALKIMKEKRLSYKEHLEFIDSIEYKDAPPCVLSGLILRDIPQGQRNNWLFSVGVYLRMKDENVDLSEKLPLINQSLKYPIEESELYNTIIKGFNRKSYFYMCSAMERCNKSLCRQKAYGVDSIQSTGLDYGELTQYMTDPPYYEWIVNGQKLVFWNEQEIISQNKFRALCLRQLHLVPRQIENNKWAKILTRACEHIKVVDQAEASGDFTSGSTFFDLTCSFFNNHRKADNITQIQLGRVYQDNERQEYVFTAKSFKDFVVIKNDFKQYSSIEIKFRLEQLGAYKEGTLWRIPIKSIPTITEPKIEIDFRDKEDDGDF